MMTQLSAKWSSWVGGISALVALVAGVLAFVYLRHFDLTIFVSAALAFASACLSLAVVGFVVVSHFALFAKLYPTASKRMGIFEQY